MQITCHMISSVDGRQVASRWTRAADPAADMHKAYAEAAAKLGADGWIVGRKTMAEFAGDIVEVREPVEGHPTSFVSTFFGNREDRPLAIVFDTHGTLHYKSNTLPTGEHIVAILGSHVTRAYQKELEQAGVSYIVRTPGKPEEETLDALKHIEKDFGVNHLLLEGGGHTNGTFLHMKLVDSMSVIVYPGLDGRAGIPSIVEFEDNAVENPMDGLTLELTDCEKLEGGLVWLRYAVNR